MAEMSQAEAALPLPAVKRSAMTGIWVTAREAFWIALEALRAHKLRSLLTLLGVVISTTTLIVVMSVINGMNQYIANHVANLGANVFILDQFQWGTTFEEFLKAQRRNKIIRLDDYYFLRDNLPDFKSIGAGASMALQLRYQGHTLDEVEVDGLTPSMIDIGQAEVESGRYISDVDYNHSEQVCFIGQDVVTEFFPNVDPLGKVLEIQGQPFQVIGVAKRIGSTFGQSEDGFVHIPLTTFTKLFAARPHILIDVQAYDPQQMLQLEDEVRVLMRVRHHLGYNDSDDFGLNASDTIMSLWQRLTGSIFAVTIAVVAVFMVVGGIVIMNIMLASVTERTHEIGIRKSLGARRRDILMQFVTESAVMAAVGGLIGVLLAVGISQIIQMFFTASVPLSAVVLGVGLSALVGLFFGIYPASQAARLDPIEALRTEL